MAEKTVTPARTESPAIEAVHISKTYQLSQGAFKPKLPLHAVAGVDLKVHKGETLGIVGESGCGKSSLSRILVGISEPSEGALLIDGVNIGALSMSKRRKAMQKVQMVFQSPFSSLDPRMTVEQIVREPLDVNRKDLAMAVRQKKVLDMLEKVGLNKAIPTRYPHQLSGGQQQRVGIARALISEPEIVICDEPVSALDVSVQAQVVNLLRELQQETGVAYIFVSHDLAVVANISDTIAVMYLGKIVEYGKCEDVLTRPQHPYTIALVDSSSEPDPAYEKNRELHVLKGELPKPTKPPSGCPFRTRCWKVRDECSQEAPKLMQREGGSQAVACHFP